MTADPLAVAAALEGSMSAHIQAKGSPRPANWLDSLQRAYTLRQQAQDMDPERESPAWETIVVFGPHSKRSHSEMHDQLMTFYKGVLPRYGAIPPAPPMPEPPATSAIAEKVPAIAEKAVTFTEKLGIAKLKKGKK